jgi:hypothetical protein
MNVGDRIQFQFAGEEKEGIVERIFAKKIYLKVDFPGHAGKRVIRPLAVLEGKVSSPNKKKKKGKVEKAKVKKSVVKEKEQEEKA